MQNEAYQFKLKRHGFCACCVSKGGVSVSVKDTINLVTNNEICLLIMHCKLLFILIVSCFYVYITKAIQSYFLNFCCIDETKNKVLRSPCQQ